MLNAGARGRLWGFAEARPRALKGESSERFLKRKNEHTCLASLQEVRSQRAPQGAVLRCSSVRT